MSDSNDAQNEQQPDPNTNPRPAAFCQHCGKPLTKDTARVVGQAVYCEPCLHAKLTGAPTAAPGYTPVNATGAGTTTGAFPAGYGASPLNGSPNPGLAFLLGLIPGVGAMYNEQYAKGLVHLVIFAILVMFSHVSGIFGLFIAGWVFYMAIEAHHTARAKRDGTPLPNPFGLNDIGERMGFAPSWINGQGVASAVEDAAHAAGFRGAAAPPQPPPQPGSPTGPQTGSPTGPATPAGSWGAPVDSYPPAQPYAQAAYAPPPVAGYGQPYSAYGTPYAAIPTPVATGAIPPFVLAPNRFPVGAIWLIALGTLFLLGTEGIFSGIRGETIVGFVIIALGVTVFARRMTGFGGSLQSSLQDNGSPDYPYRLLYALRPSVWLLLIGVLFLLDGFRILYWDHSWPLLIIVSGVMMLLRRFPLATPYPPYPYPAQPYPEPAAAQPAAESDFTRLNLRPDPIVPPISESDTDALNGGR